MFFDKNFVEVNGHIAGINAFYTQKGTKGAYVTIASQSGQDNQGNDRTNWVEFQAWGDKAQNVADIYRLAKSAPKGHKKVTVKAHIKSWKDSNNHNHMNLVLNNISMARYGKKSVQANPFDANHETNQPADSSKASSTAMKRSEAPQNSASQSASASAKNPARVNA